jgi:type IV pilus assembly protein PilC
MAEQENKTTAQADSNQASAQDNSPANGVGEDREIKNKTLSRGVGERSENKEEKEEKKVRASFKSFFIRVSLRDKVLFARHLAIGIKSGMSLQDSLRLIADQAKSKSFKIILNDLITDTNNGMFLSKSMERYASVFGQLFINVVRVGETSGTLTENLNYLAVELKKKSALYSKIRSALIYPAVILVATIGIVATLMIGVFPKILPVFSSLRIELPMSTRILIATSRFTSSYFFVIIGVIILLAIAIVFISKYEWFKHSWHHVLLRLPIAKQISVKVNCSSIARILGLLLNSGVKIIEAVNVTADALDNRVYRHELKTAGETLRRGDFFSIYLAKNPKIFPPIFTNMIQVGENTGNLTENLQYLSEFYEEDVDNVLKNLNSIIEPFLLVFMGLLVGFIAISVITPIYRISESLTL